MANAEKLPLPSNWNELSSIEKANYESKTRNLQRLKELGFIDSVPEALQNPHKSVANKTKYDKVKKKNGVARRQRKYVKFTPDSPHMALRPRKDKTDSFVDSFSLSEKKPPRKRRKKDPSILTDLQASVCQRWTFVVLRPSEVKGKVEVKPIYPENNSVNRISSSDCKDCQKDVEESDSIPRLVLNCPIQCKGSVHNRAIMTVPWPFFVTIGQNGLLGVWTEYEIPEGLYFGPYEGVISTEEPSSFSHKVTIDGDEKFIDSRDVGTSNWLRFIAEAQIWPLANLSSFQHRDRVYFTSLRVINTGEELLVWSKSNEEKEATASECLERLMSKSAKPLRSLNGDTAPTPFFLDTSRQCQKCKVLFSTKNYLRWHNDHSSCKKENIHIEVCSSSATDYSVNSIKNVEVDIKALNEDSLNDSYKENNNHFDTESSSDSAQRSLQFSDVSLPIFHSKPSSCNRRSRKRRFTKFTGRPYMCMFCNSKFRRPNDIKQHVKLHESGRIKSCPECGRNFRSHQKLEIHYHTHFQNYFMFNSSEMIAADKPCKVLSFDKSESSVPYMSCAKCSTDLYCFFDVLNHSCKPLKKKAYQCGHCFKSFAYFIFLSRHLNLHKDTLEAVTEQNLISSFNDGYTASSSSSDGVNETLGSQKDSVVMFSPLMTNTNIEVDDKSEKCKKSTHFCNICNEQFRKSQQLRRHLKYHQLSTNKKCSICNFWFYSGQALKAHISSNICGSFRKKSNNDQLFDCKTFKCHACGKLFKKHWNFAKHIENGHKTLKLAESLACHEKSSHAFEKIDKKDNAKVLCTLCHRSFSRKSSLTVHMRTHTKVGLFRCDFCFRSFNQKGNLNRHIKSHSGKMSISLRQMQSALPSLPVNADYSASLHKETFTSILDESQHVRNQAMTSHIFSRPFQITSSFEKPKTTHILGHQIGYPLYQQKSLEMADIYRQLGSHWANQTESMFLCRICNLSFSTIQSLKEHEKVHTGTHLNPISLFHSIHNTVIKENL